MNDHFADLCVVLFIGHRKRLDTHADTLNRVFRKNYEMSGGAGAFPTVSRVNMTVTLESWQTQALLDIITRPTSHAPGSIKGIGKKARHYSDTPVVVASFKGRDYLMDGNRRIQHLAELGRTEIKVYRCRVTKS